MRKIFPRRAGRRIKIRNINEAEVVGWVARRPDRSVSARLGTSLAVRFACLGHDLGKGTTPADVLPRHIGHEQRSVALVRAVCERLRVPVDCRELAEVVAREHGNVHRSAEFGAAALVRLLDRCDAWRRPERFAEMLLACECDARGRLGLEESAYPQRARLLAVLDMARGVDSAAVAADAAARGLSGPAIGEALHAARVLAVESHPHPNPLPQAGEGAE